MLVGVETPSSAAGTGAGARPGAFDRLERALVSLIEIVTAALVVAEVLILLAGVVFRYGLHAPLIWSDELAAILFLWLALLGSALALHRGEHMRMTAGLALAGPRARALLELMAITVAMSFLALVIYPALEYLQDTVAILSDQLQISTGWRASAMPIGFALMFVLGAFRLARAARQASSGPLQVALAVLIPVALIGACTLAGPLFKGLGSYNLLFFFVGGVGLGVFASIPIAFAFALATFGYLALTTRVPMVVVVGRMDEGMSHLILLSVPLFVFLGQLMSVTGMARAMIAFVASLLGHVKGGLSYVLIGAMYLVSGISGAKVADMAAVAPVLFPEMQKRGAKPGDLVALLAATGAQTETIPPSLVLITVGSVTGVSIAALFTGGLLPALILALALCVVVWARHRHVEVPKVERASLGEIGRLLIVAAPALLLPFVIRFCVIEGIATATEVSTIGVAYCFLVGLLIYRQLDWRLMRPMLVETAALSGSILLIIGAATAMAWALTQSGFSRELALWMQGLPGGAVTFMAVSVVVFAILGSVLEGIPAIVLFGPLLFPIARAMGIHDVHYAIVAILAMGLGLFAPPIGIGYYAACAVGKVDPDEGMRPIWGYLIALFFGIVLIAAVPWLSIGFL